MSHEQLEQSYPWLLPTLEVHAEPARLLLRDTERESVFRERTPELLDALELFDGSRRLDEVINGGPVVLGLLAELMDSNWVVWLSKPLAEITRDHDPKSRQLSYFAHIQRYFPERAFAELATQRVLIVGTGGVGSHLAMNLAGSGVKRFALSDPDVVSTSNLNRQVYFTRRDVGSLKVEALARALAERFDELDVVTSTVDHDVAPEAPLPACDAVVVCGERESIWSRPELVNGKPLLMAGYFGSRAVVGPCMMPGRSPSWRELVSGRGEKNLAGASSSQVRREAAWNSSGASINCTAGGLLAEATLRMLAPALGGPILLAERLELDMRTLECSRVSFHPTQPLATGQAGHGYGALPLNEGAS